jgi:glycosyltransferase involved in cell wall biosynthesis
MRLGLGMMVKDEVNRIAGCLEDILDLFEQVVVFDTGSTDGTQELLRDRFGIEPIAANLDASNCLCKSDIRNRGFSLLETPWILSLDADERIARDDLKKIIDLDDVAGVSGYFCAWNTYKNRGVVEDYKLFFFRKGARSSGLVHDNIQTDVRARGLRAEWLDGISIAHYPEPSKARAKARTYRDRLLCAIEADPSWYRYHWFLGYMCFREARLDEAVTYLSVAADSQSTEFPVECLNSAMVLAEIYARQGRTPELEDTLAAARAFHQQVAGDFEVEVNIRLGPWLDSALEYCRRNEPDSIKTYEFAY